ncbi:MAG: beta-glucosidase, partial [Rhizobiales bacterium]|nr:beta-glucosidase [Hyphomicrobiales bacterium]
FFTHYSFLGLDPRRLADRYADYFEQNSRHVLLNYTYCVADPAACAGYGPAAWGLTASDNDTGYSGHSPTNDRCVIAPTAALSSFPYAPEAAMRAMRHFHDDLGDRIWTDWGFTDAFCEARSWYSKDHLAIDQGPIVVMMENYRSGLLWRLVMQAPEVRNGLARLGFDPLVA